MGSPDLFTSTLAALERENRALRARNMELEICIANLIAAAKGVWHVQGRRAKANALKLIKRAA